MAFVQDLQLANNTLAQEVVRLQSTGGEVSWLHKFSINTVALTAVRGTTHVHQRYQSPQPLEPVHALIPEHADSYSREVCLRVAGCLQERQALREEVVKLELLLQAQSDKIVSCRGCLGTTTK